MFHQKFGPGTIYGVDGNKLTVDFDKAGIKNEDIITAIEGQIADLERQLSGLRREISAHQADLKETANVRERLHLADQYPAHKSLPPPITTAISDRPSRWTEVRRLKPEARV